MQTSTASACLIRLSLLVYCPSSSKAACRSNIFISSQPSALSRQHSALSDQLTPKRPQRIKSTSSLWFVRRRRLQLASLGSVILQSQRHQASEFLGLIAES